MSRFRDAIISHIKRGSTFLIVGGIAFVADAAIFNMLVYWEGKGPLFTFPLVAKMLSILAASCVSYIGSKLWTFKDSQRPASSTQFLQFMGLNIVAILLQMSCLGFSRYILHEANAFSDNLWGTLIGQAVATLFRYVTYNKWVFPTSKYSASGGQKATTAVKTTRHNV